MNPRVNIMWFRRDLRLTDNAALYHALKSGNPVLPIFIFDRYILDELDNPLDRRLTFIHAALEEMQDKLVKMGSSLAVHHGYPSEIFKILATQYDIEKVYTNHDYEPYARERDTLIEKLLRDAGVVLETYKDQVIFEKDEIVKDDGKPYTVYTPYSKKWRTALASFHLQPYPVEKYYYNFYQQEAVTLPSLEQIGFRKTEVHFPEKEWKGSFISSYDQTRDFPALENGTTKMSVHLRFGTVSIRQLAAKANAWNKTYLNELIWRDFYHAILWHFPRVGKSLAFKPEYDRIPWRNNETAFEKWCKGMTGYPIVDAGMRELNATGYMHNRVRMITASFLCKHLLVDWRWGEAYFAGQLLDFDLAANNGGWQWASGSGCDAAPYFRVFNPALQTAKFDKDLTYIRKWVPELDELSYPQPIVQHEAARKLALETYSLALKSEGERE